MELHADYIEQFEEACKRLGILQDMGLHENVLSDFQHSDLVNYSEYSKLGPYSIGVLYWVTNDSAKSKSGKKFEQVIREFEEKYDVLVYHATHEHTNIGELLDLFYVSDSKDEWPLDYDDLANGFASVYAFNFDDPLCSEFGTIGFSVSGGGIVRTA